MSYAISDIINLAKIAQPLARIGESKKKSTIGKGDTDLDIKLYITRKDTEYAYAQSPSENSTFEIANYLLSLMGVYLFQAQQVSGSGGSIASTSPIVPVAPYNFIVDASTSFIVNGASSKTITTFIGFNLLFVRNGVPQSQVITELSYYSWNATTGLFSFTPSASSGELFQLIPV